MRGADRSPLRSSVAFVLRNSLRLARWRQLRVAALTCGVVAASLTVLYVSLGSLSLEPSQEADRDLGRFDYSAGFGTISIRAGDADAVSAIDRGLAQKGLTDRFVSLTVVGLTIDGESVVAREGDWSAEPFPGRYALTAGRWASKPGDTVVVAGVHGTTVSVGDTISTLSGALSLEVTGIASDAYPASRSSYLLGSGTFASTPAEVGRSFEALNAQPVIFWGGVGDQRGAHVVGSVLDDYAASVGIRRPVDVAGSLESRWVILATPSQSWVADNPAGYDLPSLLLPLLTGLFVIALLSRQVRRRMSSMIAVGVSPRQATAIVSLVSAAAMVLGTLVGWAVGYAVGLAGRPLLHHFNHQPLASAPGPSSPLIRIGAGILVAAIITPVLVYAMRPKRHVVTAQPEARASRFSVRDGRHLSAACCAAVLMWQTPATDSPSDAMTLGALFAVVAALVAPDALRLVVHLLPERGPRQRLTKRMLASTPGRFGAATGVFTLAIALAVGFVTLVATLLVSSGMSDTPEVLDGQVLVTDRATPIEPAPAHTVDLVRREVPSATATQLYFLTSGITKHSSTVEMGVESSFVMAVETVDDAKALLGRDLDDTERAVLEGGGLIDWRDSQPSGAEGSVELRVIEQRSILDTVTVPSVAEARPLAGWSNGKDALMLLSAARSRDLPFTSGAVVFAGVTTAQARSIDDAVERSGIDPGTVRTHHRADGLLPPLALRLTSLGLFAITVLLMVAETRGRVLELSGYARTLVAIGLRPWWVRTVLAAQQTILIGVATAVGVVFGVVSVWMAAQAMGDEYLVSVPWSDLIWICAALYLAATAALLVGMRKLSASARQPRRAT